MRLKYKDVIILLFLGGVLIYAACRRNNLLPLKEGEAQATAGSKRFHWQDTIYHGHLEIIADSGKGILIYSHGQMLAGVSDVKPEALHLEKGVVCGTDTLDLLYCLTGENQSIPCYRILPDGTLAGVGI